MLFTNKIFLDGIKFKAFADDSFKVAEIMSSVFDGGDIIAGYHQFLLFSQCFQKVSPSGSLKVVIVW